MGRVYVTMTKEEVSYKEFLDLKAKLDSEYSDKGFEVTVRFEE